MIKKMKNMGYENGMSGASSNDERETTTTTQ